LSTSLLLFIPLRTKTPAHIAIIGFGYYASAKFLTTQFYDDLVYRGWRRLGTILYKPDLRASCCPQYTIRLDACEFKATRDQRQALNRFNRFVLGDEYVKEAARVHPRSKTEAAKRKTEFDLIQRIHESERQTVKSPPEPAHRFEVTLEPDTFTEEKYAVFENYQRVVHQEPPSKISKGGFKNFLCSSPLQRSKQTVDGQERELGSYHQCYRLDGRLLAIGVLDLMPHAVSGVYFLYHEDFHKWGPGKLSAMREAALALEKGYRWYMMGFYIHSCKKMRYKGDFHPQSVLDPESYTWDPLDDDLKRRFNARKYVSMSRERREAIPVPEDDEQPSEEQDGSDAVDSEVGTDDLNDEKMDAEAMPLFERNMPGIATRSELDSSQVDHVKLRIRGEIYEASDLVAWESSTIDEPHSIKCVITDLVAAVGQTLASRLCVTFE